MEDKKFVKRTDYSINDPLIEQDLPLDPFKLFQQWFEIAVSRVEKDANAMTLATYDGEFPRSRMVLLRELDVRGFVYFTNYLSDKVSETNAHPKASLTFYWKELERQVRIEGVIEKISSEESDKYFQSRPYESKIGAWASPQSKEIISKKWLNDQVAEYKSKFDHEVDRPEFWGGLRLVPTYIEFWQGQASRLHDRITYKKEGEDWSKKRIAP
jgi:pyridoxamine 5'-phosphate oxidase